MFYQTSPPWPVYLGWPYTTWLSFTELDKAIVHVIRLASCLWLWFQSTCPLMSSLSAYYLTGFFLPWMWGISSRLLQQCTAGYLLTAATPDLRCGISPHGCPSWPWTWGISFQRYWIFMYLKLFSPGTNLKLLIQLLHILSWPKTSIWFSEKPQRTFGLPSTSDHFKQTQCQLFTLFSEQVMGKIYFSKHKFYHRLSSIYDIII